MALASLDCNKIVDEIFDSIFAVPAELEVEVIDENRPKEFGGIFLDDFFDDDGYGY